MNVRTRIRGIVLLAALAMAGAGGLVLLATPPVEAARCCWVMVCSPYACWEECRTCPKFP
jgi:hypothetical protein